MEVSVIAKKLGLANSKPLIRKAEELRRLSEIQFDSCIIGVGEVCKAIICLEIAATKFQVSFDRKLGIKMSGLSEKAYIRSYNSIYNTLGIKMKLDVRELGILFGCVRLIPFVEKGLSTYKERFFKALPPSRRAGTDFNRPVFTAVAFYLSAKRQKLKVDKQKLIELCGTIESEFISISTSMEDLCFDVFGISKEKKDPRTVKGHRELLDVLPTKRRLEDDGDISDDSSVDCDTGVEFPSYKRRKHEEKLAYDDWKLSVLTTNRQSKAKAPTARKKQARLDFTSKSSKTITLEAS